MSAGVSLMGAAHPRGARSLAGVLPMLATIGTEVPRGPRWVFEPKYDGLRVLAAAGDGHVLLLSRNGNDKTAQFPEVAAAVRALWSELGRFVVLDGEIVAVRDGRALRFHALQPRIHVRGAQEAALLALEQPATLVAFDCLLDGEEALVELPWKVRRRRLERLLDGRTNERLRLAPATRDAAALFRRARRERWEGLVAKHDEAPYVPGRRTRAWLKLKLERSQEFVVVGYSASRTTRRRLGSLLLAVHDDAGALTFCGHVGTGLTAADLDMLARRLRALHRTTPPPTLDAATVDRAHVGHRRPRGEVNDPEVTWVEPRLVVRVRFNEWTPGGRVRHAVYEGVRDDVAPASVRREEPAVAADLPQSA